MSRFADEKKLKQIDLGDGEWVKIPEKLSYGTIAEIGEVDSSSAEKTTKLLVAILKEWNLKDDDGEDVEINEKNIKMLDIQTITQISTVLGEILAPDKKKSIG